MLKQFPTVCLVLVLAAVMLVSGCVAPGPTVGVGAGVVITDWTPDFSEVKSGDQVQLKLRVQNQGTVKAENVRAEITGITLEDWNAGFFETEDLGDLIAADPETNTPGQSRSKTWNLRAPQLAKGIEFTYEPVVKVSYDYSTIARKPITLVDVDELRRIKQQGKSLPSKSTQYSAGPLSVEVKTGDYVKTSDEWGTEYDIFPIYIEITNTGWEQGGTVIPGSFAYGEENYPVEIKITPPTGTVFRSTGFGGLDCTSTMTIDLWKGKSADITCELEVTSPPAYQEDRLLTVELNYRYQTEARTQIKVTGTGEGGFW